MPNQPIAGTESDGQKPASTIVNLDIQEVAVDPEQTQLLECGQEVAVDPEQSQLLECGQEASGEYCPTDETETLLMVSVATANPATPDTYHSLYLRGLVARTKQTQRRYPSGASDEEMQSDQSDEETSVTSASSAEEEGPIGTLSSGSKEEGQNTQS